MFEALAHSGDPGRLAGFLDPSSYPGNTYFTIFENLSAIYFVPLAFSFLIVWIVRRISGRKFFLSVSMALIVVAPPALWLVLVYSDPSFKGGSNTLELALLGMLVGILLASDGRFVRPLLNGVTSAWALCAVAMGLYLYVPGHPSRPPTISEISQKYLEQSLPNKSLHGPMGAVTPLATRATAAPGAPLPVSSDVRLH